VILPNFYCEFEKPLIKIFGHDLRKIFIILPKKSTKDENFTIFQTAVRKYVENIYEKSQSGYFFCFSHRFKYEKRKIFQNFTISKMKTRAQIFPKIDKNDFNELKHNYYV
jgi:hypothetical protein